MDIATIREKILSDDAFVLAETKKIQYLFGLKYEIRYGLERTPEDFTESVADHVYAMHIVSDYFLPIEQNTSNLNIPRMRQMITWHDIDELETGDVISWQKSPEQIANEEIAWQEVLPHIPAHLSETVTDVVGDYESRISLEAKYVKAIDKVEPIFHLYTAKGKAWSQGVGLTRNNADRVKLPHVKEFPYIKRFIDVVHNQMESEGFFVA
jgi:5'-deoxynucleotidase YfbR-like HD superfamily hydrolase